MHIFAYKIIAYMESAIYMIYRGFRIKDSSEIIKHTAIKTNAKSKPKSQKQGVH